MIHNCFTGGGPAPKYQPILEAVLDSMARQAVDGIASQRSETDPFKDILSSQVSKFDLPCTKK